MGQREWSIADRCRTGDVSAIAFTGAGGDADGVAALFGISMAAVDRKAARATDGPTAVSAIPPVDGRREAATADVGAAGHCSTESRAFGGVHRGSVQTERGIVRLVGSHVAAGLVVVWTGIATLIGAGTVVGAGGEYVDGRAALLQGHGLGWPAIAGQGCQLRIGVQARLGREAAAITVQVVAVVLQAAKVLAVAARVLGHDAAVAAHRPTTVVKAATDAGRVVGDGAGADAHCTIVENAAAVGRLVGRGAVVDAQRATIVENAAAFAAGRVVGKGAVVDAQRATIVENAAAAAKLVGSGVIAQRAVADAQRAIIVENAAAVAGNGAIGDGEGIEGEVAARGGEHLYLIVSIEGDALPAAIDGHASSDGEGAAEQDVPAATESNGIPVIVAVGYADIGLQLAIIATIGDGEGGRGMGLATGQGRAAQQAKTQQETERHQAQPGCAARCRSWVHERQSFLAAPKRRLSKNIV